MLNRLIKKIFLHVVQHTCEFFDYPKNNDAMQISFQLNQGWVVWGIL